jgi:hypothetical protein
MAGPVVSQFELRATKVSYNHVFRKLVTSPVPIRSAEPTSRD